MNVSLNVSNDAELRAYIKDMIKGQILAVTREEIKEIITAELTRKMKGSENLYINNLIKDATTRAIKETLRSEFGITAWNQEFVVPVIEKHIKEVSKSVDINEKIEQMVNRRINEVFDALIKAKGE